MSSTVMEASEFEHKPGEQIGPYVLEKPLGSGGFAEVWEATDAAAGRQVAIKIFFDRIVKDATVWRAIREEPKKQPEHERIVPIYYCHLDSDNAPGPYYVVMKFMRGGTLEELLERTAKLPLEQAVAITRDVLAGLSYAHSKGIVHRDIKPTNILFDASGRAALADFGIAKDLRKAASAHSTVFGAVVGTAAYMSHEQGEGLPVNEATDIYSVGTVLYEMLAGKVPFEGPTDTAIIVARSKNEPPPLRTALPEVPLRMEKVVLNCLTRDLDHRYPDCASLLRALDWASANDEVERHEPKKSSLAPKLILVGALLAVVAAALWFVQSSNTHAVTPSTAGKKTEPPSQPPAVVVNNTPATQPKPTSDASSNSAVAPSHKKATEERAPRKRPPQEPSIYSQHPN